MGVGQLAGEAVGQLDEARAAHEVLLVKLSHSGELIPEHPHRALGDQRAAVLTALARANDELAGPQQHVLDAQPTSLEQTCSRPVEKHRDAGRSALHSREHVRDLFTAEDHRQPHRALGAREAVDPWHLSLQYVPVQKENRAQRLVLGRRRDATIDGESFDEGPDPIRAGFPGIPAAEEQPVAADPMQIRLLGPAAVVARPQHRTHSIREPPAPLGNSMPTLPTVCRTSASVTRKKAAVPGEAGPTPRTPRSRSGLAVEDRGRLRPLSSHHVLAGTHTDPRCGLRPAPGSVAYRGGLEPPTS